ncbi:hypothetical protein PR003_g19369 [Phytophthora rubi]|uniref:RxLR effector protein n=1 Tax=Phytophthora rubi TaxID=129364 RepID=A0A6A3K1G1_9STRA|nr:hypothetical protein PR002_g18718 [Phytophthora rubi]KAE9017761.1 hypothetical protein PR001_g14313 [Phytophthora rubi]KAE9313955.1 hypothetical protein PR003_g19369 [Phytophthora rubi]
MRISYVVLIALSVLLVSRECDATSPAAKVLEKKTQNLVGEEDNESRFLRSHDTDDADTTSVEREERLRLTSLSGLARLKKVSEKVPIDLDKVPIAVQKTKADFSRLYVDAMLEHPTFKTKMFKKWDVYTSDEIVPNMKKVHNERLVLEYMNRRSIGFKDGTIVTGKANINTNLLSL